jgi:NCAIR mutase (PurE)-related protein
MVVKPDFERDNRCGIPEVIYGKSKSIQDLLNSTTRFLNHNGRAIITRIDKSKALQIGKHFENIGLSVQFNDRAQVLVLKRKNFKLKKRGLVGILAAGTSDVAVAEEARVLVEEFGCNAISEYDVGVAGIHRLFKALKRMRKANVLIAIAGMEGALPSVVSGLVKVPVIGVPTSVGYGLGEGGVAALCAMLNSCSPVAVVNIDNGYGAAAIAYKIAAKHR